MRGFTLIEIIIYCSIFVVFAIVTIQSVIWLNSSISRQENISNIDKGNIYKVRFNNIYKKYKLNNSKIESKYKELINVSTSTTNNIINIDQYTNFKLFNSI